MLFYLLLLLLALQRLQEVLLGQKNFKKLEAKLMAPFDQREKKQMVLLHTLWFLSCGFEYYLGGSLVSGPLFLIGMSLLMGAQLVRYKTINLMGKQWVPYPIAFYDQNIITDGPYKYLKHPNYLMVIIEIMIVPLLGGCYFTAILFSVLNLLFILRRIKIEEGHLGKHPSYQKLNLKKKLIPFVFLLAIMPGVSWGEIVNYSYRSFEEAKSSPTYFKFAGKSTKLGLITTNFEGYARESRLDFDSDSKLIKNITLTIKSSSLDTDNNSRDEKLREKCLQPEKYENIIVQIPVLSLVENEQTVPGTMKVREKEVPLQITIKKSKDDEFSGETRFKISEAGIPDPSIAIAKVQDEIKIKFNVVLK